MKKTLLVALSVLMLCLPVFALADSTLSVRGNATVAIEPDSAVLNIGYACQNADPSIAQAETAEHIQAILDVARALGVEDKDIATSQLNIHPVNSYANDAPELVGYRVEHMLSITIHDLTKVGEALDAILATGANQSYGISYTSSKASEVYLQALKLAIASGEAKADAMAIAAGVWLGALEEINEQSDYAYINSASMRSAYDAAAQAEGSMGDTLMTGMIEISAAVELVYTIK